MISLKASDFKHRAAIFPRSAVKITLPAAAVKPKMRDIAAALYRERERMEIIT